MKKVYIIFFVINLIIVNINSYSATNISAGNVSGTWTSANSPYYINGNITVASGTTLVIQPGVSVEFTDAYSLTIIGKITAIGTSSSFISITTYYKNTAGWKGVRFVGTTGDTSRFEYCKFSNGKVNYSMTNYYDQWGGAIYVQQFNKVVISNCIFNNNAAMMGGAIATNYSSPIILNSVFCNNHSNYYGGAIAIEYTSSPALVNNTIVNNYSGSGGGGLDIYGSSPVIRNTIIYGNDALYSFKQIWSSGYSNLYNCVVQDGHPGVNIIDADPKFVSPTSGAGLSYNGLTANWSLQSSSPCYNKGQIFTGVPLPPDYDLAGNIRIDIDTIDIGAYEYIASTVASGSVYSATWSGYVLLTGDIVVKNGYTLTIQPGTKIRSAGNYYVKVEGRVLAEGKSDSLITFTSLKNNGTWKGIKFYGTSTANDSSKFVFCVVKNCVNLGTTVFDQYGGAFLIYSFHKVLLSNCMIYNNKAYYGGGLSVYSVTAGYPKFVNNLIVFNESVYHGGGLFLTNAYGYFINNNLSRNKCGSSYYGGGICAVSSSNTYFKNNIIWDNTGYSSYKNIYVSGSLSIEYSDVEGGYSGTGNINVNPQYKYIVNGYGYGVSYYEYSDWTLNSTSPCIDAGTSVSSIYYTSVDLKGKTRVFNSVIDIGPYEDKSFITVCGNITSNTIWDAKKVKINCDVTVNNGVTLVIPPGTVIEFQGAYKLDVKGRILAYGDTNNKIVFTALNKTIGWKGVRFDYPSNSNDSSRFINCIFEYGNTPNISGQHGGAMYLYRWSKVRIDRCLFRYNKAVTSPSYSGGAIYISSSNVIITNSTFHNNRATYGAAIYLSYSDAIITNDTFYQDSASMYGGVFYLTSPNNSVIKNCFLANNYAAVRGGAMFIMNFNATSVHNNLIVNNYAQDGGAIYAYYDCPTNFNNNTIAFNKATNGGAIYTDNNSDIILRNNIIYGNTATNANQVFISDVASDPKFYNSVVQDGTSGFSGTGSGSNYNGVFLNNIDINPSFVSPSSGSGTGYNGFTANWALNSTSKCINSGTRDTIGLNLPDKDITGNPRIYNGRIDMGAIESQSDLVYCGTISENTTWDADKVKISCDVTIANGVTLTIEKGTEVEFQGLYAIHVQGRLLVKGSANENVIFTVADTNYFSKYDSLNGGWHGIHFSSVNTGNDTSKIEFATFKYAKAVGGNLSDWYGGALNIYNTSKLIISNCLFTNNYAKYYGGAIFMESSNPIIVNSVFSNNSAYGYTYNNIHYTYGGAIYMDDASPILANNTFVNNSARFGGGLYLWASTPVIKNCIIYGNKSNSGYWYYGDNLSVMQGSNPIISNCDIEGGLIKIVNYPNISTFTNNIDVNPDFISATIGTGAFVFNDFANWGLKQSSLLINKGTKSLSGLNVPSIDRAGNIRIVGDTSDIGGYEVQISPYFISSKPQDKTVCQGSSATFSVNVTIPVYYQWQKNGVNILNANSSTYTIATTTMADTGKYSCIISNNYGSMITDTARLYILTNPQVIKHPLSTARCIDDTVSFYCNVQGSEPITYQWYNTNGVIGNATTNPYVLNSINNGHASNYYCKATNVCGIVTSNNATLTVKSPPTVSSLAPSYTVCENNAVVFSITATGTPTITYQWYKDSAPISNAYNATYSVSSASSSHAGNYYCKSTNSCGSDSTNISVLTVNTRPSITSQTASNVSYCEGSSMTLTVTASGTAPLTYQWYKNSSQITGATNNTFTISSVSTADAGTYYCIVTNLCGTQQCNSINVVIYTTPVITAQTSNSTRCVGQSMTFSVTASGNPSPTYQWYKDNNIISSATNNQYSISSVSTGSAGNYYCIVSNSCGFTTSNTIELTINQSPSITTHPSNLTICSGQSSNFTVNVTGTTPLYYQWYKNSNQITGATNSFFTISSSSVSDAASYYCVITNACGSVQSNTATLTVNTAPGITAQSGTATRCVNQSNTFSITATGTPTPTFQWYFDNNAISSATNSSYTINSVGTSNSGNYYCIATNSCGNIQSATQTLTVNSPPSILTQSSSTTKCTGQSTTLSINATGTLPLSYQWYFKNNAINGATNSTYSISSIDTTNAGAYYCKVINSCGSAQSNTIDITVNMAPTILSQTSGSTRCVGQSMTFSITASGTNPITYQWYYNNSKITGATNFTYTINSVALSDAGNYTCIATNSCGSVTSAAISLTINTSPTINTQSSNSSICEGKSTTFEVNASGSSPLTYQWYFNNNAINGALSNYYSINSATTSDGGSYYCVVTNTCGNKQSNNISLTVNQSPKITSYTSNATRCEGQSMTFSITATGTAPISYQWYKDGIEVFGAKNNSYTINILNASDAGSYYCIATNSCGNAQSPSTNLTINAKPVLTMLSNSDTICSGDNIMLSTSVTGTTPITYQWYFNTLPIINASNSFLFFNSVKLSNQGNYFCIATNSCGTSTSATVSLTVNNPLTITSQSDNISVCKGDSAKIKVTATGTLPIVYQIYNNKGLIAQATSSVAELAFLPENDDEMYVVFTNPCGSLSSNNIKVKVNKKPEVNIGKDTTFCKGGNVVLSAGYGYFCKWSDGSINPQLTVTKSGTYFVEVTDINGCKAISNTVKVAVMEPYNGEQICVVTNDPNTGKNLIAWERTKGKKTSSYNIYRETTSSGVYEKIGNLPFDSVSVFVDDNSNPKQKAFRYRITSVDSCGNESLPSSPHKTIHLTVNAGVGGQINLIWSHYEGFPFSTYRIYRGTHPDSMLLLDNIQSSFNSYTDINPPKKTVFYQVAVVKPDTCFPTILRGSKTNNTGPFSQSTSNIKDYNIGQTSYLDVYPLELQIERLYGSKGTIELFTNLTDLNVESTQGWLNITKDLVNNKIELMALSENTFKYARSSHVIISGNGVTARQVLVYQLGTDGTSSLPDELSKGEMLVYPNPVTNIANVILPDSEKEIKYISFYDLNGKIIYEQSNVEGNMMSINVGNIASGCYFIKVVGEKTYYQKLVIQ